MSILELTGAQITLLVGDAGSGKTFLTMNHPDREKAFYLDMEYRYAKMLEHHPEIPLKPFIVEPDKIKMTKTVTLGSFYVPLIIDRKTFVVDKIATFKMVDTALTWAFATPGIKLIVLDGIEDLRRMATEKVEAEENKAAFGPQMWQKINNDVKHLIHRTINFCRLFDVKFVMTTHFETLKNEDGEPTSQTKINAKDYILNPSDEITALKRDGVDFWYKRGKSPRGPTELTEWTIHEQEEQAN